MGEPRVRRIGAGTCSRLSCFDPACTFPLNIEGRALPNLCCGHQDAFMVRMAEQVAKAGQLKAARRGVKFYRRDHSQWHEERDERVPDIAGGGW